MFDLLNLDTTIVITTTLFFNIGIGSYALINTLQNKSFNKNDELTTTKLNTNEIGVGNHIESLDKGIDPITNIFCNNTTHTKLESENLNLSKTIDNLYDHVDNLQEDTDILFNELTKLRSNNTDPDLTGFNQSDSDSEQSIKILNSEIDSLQQLGKTYKNSIVQTDINMEDFTTITTGSSVIVQTLVENSTQTESISIEVGTQTNNLKEIFSFKGYLNIYQNLHSEDNITIDLNDVDL
jgi:hypothetical protein